VTLPGPAAESVALADLESDPHPVLARLRAVAPACWVPVLGAWLVTGYDLAVEVLRAARSFTVDDPRFSTAKVVGPSMLSLDGARHARHRAPFTRPFRSDEIGARLDTFTRAEAGRLVSAIEPRGAAEIRRAVAGRDVSWVVIQCEAITDIDVSAAQMLEQLDVELNARGVHLAFVELRTRLQTLLRRYELFDQIDQQHIYANLDAALIAIQEDDTSG